LDTEQDPSFLRVGGEGSEFASEVASETRERVGARVSELLIVKPLKPLSSEHRRTRVPYQVSP
jgi:hypothetical protein